MTGGHTRGMPWLLPLGLLATSCSSTVELAVEVHTDLRVPDEADRLTGRVRSNGGAFEQAADLEGSSPFLFRVVAAEPTTVELEVELFHDGAIVASASTSASLPSCVAIHLLRGRPPAVTGCGAEPAPDAGFVEMKDAGVEGGSPDGGVNDGGPRFSFPVKNVDPDPLAYEVAFSVPTNTTCRFDSERLAFSLGCSRDRPQVTEVNGLVALSMSSLEIAGLMRIVGDRAVVFLVRDSATIAGMLDATATGTISGPGGGVCPGNDAPLGGGDCNGGGGGGGGGAAQDGASGGSGHDGSCTPGLGGASHQPTDLVPLLGGCNGGTGALENRPSALGGGGGGALQIVAREIAVSGTIAAAAGGGRGAISKTGTNDGGGGGGGGGGAILLEAEQVTFAGGSLNAAGGGGGGGASNEASGGLPAEDGADGLAGGAGGAALLPDGGNGGDGGGALPPIPGSGGASFSGGGGGGGSGGVIRIDTATCSGPLASVPPVLGGCASR